MENNNSTPVYEVKTRQECSMLDTCDCKECITWNAPLCELCFLNRCEIETFPEYKKFCDNCIPSDRKKLVFVLGDQTTKITTTIDSISKLSDSIFKFILENGDMFVREHPQVLRVPFQPKFTKEIERALQGHEVVSEAVNELLEDELDYFTGRSDYELLYELENICSCGNRKSKRNSKCRECHEKLLKGNAPLCQICHEKKVGWDKGRKRYFRSCIECNKKNVCSSCKNDKPEWDRKNKVYFDLCKSCYDFMKKKSIPFQPQKRICLECSAVWRQTVWHAEGQHDIV